MYERINPGTLRRKVRTENVLLCFAKDSIIRKFPFVKYFFIFSLSISMLIMPCFENLISNCKKHLKVKSCSLFLSAHFSDNF